MIYKEQAKKLIKKFIGTGISYVEAKQWAIIAVNEILKTIKEDDDDISSAEIFWTKVLIELEKM